MPESASTELANGISDITFIALFQGYPYGAEFITGTADVTWSSDKSIGDVVSDNQDDTNYVGEDQTYHCTLVRSDGKTGDVIGVKAQLVQ